MIWKDSRVRSVVFVAPILYAVLFSAVYIRHTLYDVPIAVVALDGSQTARTYLRMLQGSSKINVSYVVESVDEVKDLLYKGSIDAAVVIPRDFTERLKRGHDVSVPSYLNAASMVTANIAAKAINLVTQTFSAGVEIKKLMKHGASSQQAREDFMPVKLDLRPLFNPDFNYSNFMIPGILTAILQQVILLAMALVFTGERENGTLPELLSISRSPLALMMGKMLHYFLVNFIVAEIYLRLIFPLNSIPMEGSWPLAISFTALFVLTVVTWGLWMGAAFRTRLFATQALMFLALPSFILSGFTWPQQAMPEFIQVIAQTLPLTHFLSAFRMIYLGDLPAAYLVPSFLKLAAFVSINLILSYFVIRRFYVEDASAPEDISTTL